MRAPAWCASRARVAMFSGLVTMVRSVYSARLPVVVMRRTLVCGEIGGCGGTAHPGGVVDDADDVGVGQEAGFDRGGDAAFGNQEAPQPWLFGSTVLEESGVVGIYTNPRHVIACSDGEVRQQFSICFRGRYLSAASSPTSHGLSRSALRPTACT
jgi:hypothetical protein